LIILSDLWGARKSGWLVNFQNNLENKYRVKFYDVCSLGEIDLSDFQEEKLHRQFVDFGIQKAVQNILELEKKPKIYLGSSVGGVILWKAGLEGLPIKKLIAISSTRLRKESEKPNCPLELFFGENDVYKPDDSWFTRMKINAHFIQEGDHDIYKDQFFVSQILHQSNLK